MPYHKRAGQLHNTLISFLHHYGNRTDVEVVIMEDVKNKEDSESHNLMRAVIDGFPELNIAYDMAGRLDEWNPSRLFNAAAVKAGGEYFVITNPECFHKTDILKGLDEEFNKDPNVYVVCACESIREFRQFIKRFDELGGAHHRWYQHSEHRNVMYHFCNAISRDNYFKTGGFDERYALGMGYDDNDFLKSVLSSGIKVILRDDLHTVHQWHGRTPRPKEYLHLYKKNETLFRQKWGN